MSSFGLGCNLPGKAIPPEASVRDGLLPSFD
jgi:hypothetical protein